MKASDPFVMLSVIIPACNVETYIGECVRSVLDSLGKGMEIIIVDDGSTDHTLDIINDMARMHPEIVVISQNNQGVTSARIQGVKAAKGKYVGFVDGDDYIKKGMLEYLCAIAEREQVDAVFNQQYIRKSGKDESVIDGGVAQGFYRKDDGTISYIMNHLWDYRTGKGILPNIWCNIYKKVLVEKIMYEMPHEVGFAEDEMFIFGLMAVIDKISVVNRPYYVYRLRKGSVCNTKYRFFLRDINYKFLYLDELFEGNAYAEQLRKQLIHKTVQEVYSFRFLSKGASEFHMFPYEKIPAGSNVIIYGAGQVGRSYYKQICTNKYCNIAALCDERFSEIDDMDVYGPDELKKIEIYDYVLIAILNEEAGKQIKIKLCNKYGISQERIITHTPLSILNFIEV